MSKNSRRILICFSYRGDEFCGSQIQENGITVEEVLTKVLSAFLGEEIKLLMSSRTDSGVHAENATAHFDMESEFDVSRLPFATAHLLPDSLKIKWAAEVPKTFHARHGITKKTYRYSVYVSKTPLPVYEKNRMWVREEINIEEMKKAARHLIGTYDFSAFCASGSASTSKERTIYEIHMEERTEDPLSCVKINGERLSNPAKFIDFTLCGNGFLYNMVRIMVGTLLEVGSGKLKPRDVKTILESRDRKQAGKTLPPHALTLVGVEYENG